MKDIIIKSVSDFAEVITGGTPSTRKPEYWDGEIPWLNSGTLNDGDIHSPSKYITELGLRNSSAKMMPKGTVLIALTGATTGQVGYLTFEASANQSVTGILPSKEHHPRYLYYYLKSQRAKMQGDAFGGAQPHINQKYIKDFKIPLPPIADQKRIAYLLGKVEGLIAQRKQHLQHFDDLLKSIFLEMFGDPVRNEKGWELSPMNSFSESRLGKMRDKKFITGNHLRKYLGNSNVQWFRFVLDELLEMDFDERERETFRLEYGDLIVCEGGEIGRCAIWKNQIDDCYFQKALHRVRLDQRKVIPEYLQYVFLFYSLFNGFKITSKATIAHLTGEKLKVTLVPVPPVDLQNQFAVIVEKVEGIKSRYQASLTDLETLYGALSQKAFKGDLDLSRVPLPPDDTEAADPPEPNELTTTDTFDLQINQTLSAASSPLPKTYPH